MKNWRKIAQGAAEQSKRNLIPELRLFDKKADFLAALAAFDRIIVAYEEAAKEGETAALVRALSGLEAGAKVLFIFGPEGGLSPEEIAVFGQAGAVSAGLGPRILRAETAPLYALTAVSVMLELEIEISRLLLIFSCLSLLYLFLWKAVLDIKNFLWPA